MARRLWPGRRRHTEEFTEWLERATRVFDGYGIDIHRVAEDGCDETGYDEFQLDDAGHRTYWLSGETVKRRREWPSREAALACLRVAAEKPGMP